MVIGLIPSDLLASDKGKREIIDFPYNNGQIRHGDFSLSNNKTIQTNNLVDYLEKHVFYKNGFSKGNNDLLNLNFKFHGKPHSCSWIGNELHYNSKDRVSELNRLIQLNESQPEVFALQLKGEVSFDLKSRSMLVPLEGECILNDTAVNSNILIIEPEGSITIRSEKECKLILISDWI